MSGWIITYRFHFLQKTCQSSSLIASSCNTRADLQRKEEQYFSISTRGKRANWYQLISNFSNYHTVFIIYTIYIMCAARAAIRYLLAGFQSGPDRKLYIPQLNFCLM